MSTRKLRSLLEDLRQEISTLKVQDPELEKSLDKIAKDLEQSIARHDVADSTAVDHEPLISRIQDSLEAFETMHPRLTSVLGQLLSALSQNRL